MNKNFKSKAIGTRKTQELFLMFSMTKVSMSPLRSPQRVRFLSTRDPLQANTKVNSALQCQSSHEEDNTIFLVLNHKLGSPRAMPGYLGDES
jgi:hypothetical protein